MNSFNFIARGIDAEVARQAEVWESGGEVIQQTYDFNAATATLSPRREKEEADDYRYFPEPDLPPLRISPEWLAVVRAGLPELPAARRTRYERELGLPPYDAGVLTSERDAGDLLEATLAAGPGLAPKTVANWIGGEVLRLRNAGLVVHPVSAVELATLIRLVEDGTISRANGKTVLEEHARSGAPVTAIIERSGFRQISDASTIASVVAAVVAANPAAVADVAAGKEQAIKFLVGQVMRATRGQANAGVAEAALRERLAAADREAE
jgi:aspartyl-tRNA(Asn)/glutamyl-tRNA(Gln) amidotransferase subunit B